MSVERVQLPSMEHTFNISIKGDDTGKHYDGDFTYVRPNLQKKTEISKMKVRLNGDLKTLPIEFQIFNEMSATLFHCLVKFPEWWAESNYGRDLYDVNVIEEIYKECMKFEDEWSKKVWGDKEEDIKNKK